MGAREARVGRFEVEGLERREAPVGIILANPAALPPGNTGTLHAARVAIPTEVFLEHVRDQWFGKAAEKTEAPGPALIGARDAINPDAPAHHRGVSRSGRRAGGGGRDGPPLLSSPASSDRRPPIGSARGECHGHSGTEHPGGHVRSPGPRPGPGGRLPAQPRALDRDHAHGRVPVAKSIAGAVAHDEYERRPPRGGGAGRDRGGRPGVEPAAIVEAGEDGRPVPAAGVMEMGADPESDDRASRSGRGPGRHGGPRGARPPPLRTRPRPGAGRRTPRGGGRRTRTGDDGPWRGGGRGRSRSTSRAWPSWAWLLGEVLGDDVAGETPGHGRHSGENPRESGQARIRVLPSLTKVGTPIPFATDRTSIARAREARAFSCAAVRALPGRRRDDHPGPEPL